MVHGLICGPVLCNIVINKLHLKIYYKWTEDYYGIRMWLPQG